MASHELKSHPGARPGNHVPLVGIGARKLILPALRAFPGGGVMSGSGGGLHVYAAVVKNLRGIIYSSLEPEDLQGRLSWLKKRFRYRNIGLTPSMVEKYGLRADGKLLVELAEPVRGLGELISALASITGIRRDVLEAYCYASIYVSPILVLGQGSCADLAPLVVDEVLVKRELTDKEYKLHMRIADYTVLDFYLWATSLAGEALGALARGGDVRAMLAERRERIEKDKRRYWRVRAGEGRALVLYLDLLPVLAERASAEEVASLVERYGDLMPATLSIVSAIVV